MLILVRGFSELLRVVEIRIILLNAVIHGNHLKTILNRFRNFKYVIYNIVRLEIIFIIKCKNLLKKN